VVPNFERQTLAPNTTVPETVFFMFQMTFAIITPALIVGAFVERMKFESVLLFCGLGVPSDGDHRFRLMTSSRTD
jgi:Amt family ammonium transporter